MVDYTDIILVKDQLFLYKPRLYLIAGSGIQLFDHIAECLAAFVHDRDLQDEVLPLGFTFSFPCSQAGKNYFYVK